MQDAAKGGRGRGARRDGVTGERSGGSGGTTHTTHTLPGLTPPSPPPRRLTHSPSLLFSLHLLHYRRRHRAQGGHYTPPPLLVVWRATVWAAAGSRKESADRTGREIGDSGLGVGGGCLRGVILSYLSSTLPGLSHRPMNVLRRPSTEYKSVHLRYLSCR
ncbi:hypothetical protein E2C01_021582 [Portunus trituberculatus]|uniref:Uncharacterized protein n=1 Tax=Portunus trituberculatus TaxID=210409 RepID=A0A5B7E4M8_PORTR|nr:hypothetical protein [Portunus trituberculatus]